MGRTAGAKLLYEYLLRILCTKCFHASLRYKTPRGSCFEKPPVELPGFHGYCIYRYVPANSLPHTSARGETFVHKTRVVFAGQLKSAVCKLSNGSCTSTCRFMAKGSVPYLYLYVFYYCSLLLLLLLLLSLILCRHTVLVQVLNLVTIKGRFKGPSRVSSGMILCSR